MSLSSSLSFEQDEIDSDNDEDLPILLVSQASFGVLFAAMVISSWIVGSTCQWVVEKGLFRKDFFQKENQYNVLVGVSGLAANLQAIGCFWNALLVSSGNTSASFGLTIALGINMLFMNHSSLMLVSRKVSLTYPNAEQTWKRSLWIHAPMIPVSLVGATVWAISRHPDGFVNESIDIDWELFQTILVAVQIGIWGFCEASLSALFCFQMWRYEWTQVERKGQAVLALIAVCDITCIIVTVMIGDLQGLCLWGLVYSLRVRLEVRVMTAMIEFIQLKRSAQIYSQNKSRRRQRRMAQISKNAPSEDDDLSDAGSLASTASGRSVFSRIQIPHPHDLTQLFTSNFFSDFLVSSKQGLSNQFSSMHLGLQNKRKGRTRQQHHGDDIHGGDAKHTVCDNHPHTDDPHRCDKSTDALPFGSSFRFSRLSGISRLSGFGSGVFGGARSTGNSTGGRSAGSGKVDVWNRRTETTNESSLRRSGSSNQPPPIQEVRMVFTNALEAVPDEESGAFTDGQGQAPEQLPGNINNIYAMRDDVSDLDTSRARSLDVSKHSTNSGRRRFMRALPVRGSGNPDDAQQVEGQADNEAIDEEGQLNDIHQDHQEPFVVRFNGQVDRDNLSDLAISSQSSLDSSDEESFVSGCQDVENGLQQLSAYEEIDTFIDTLAADLAIPLHCPRPPSATVPHQNGEERERLHEPIIESHKAAQHDTNDSMQAKPKLQHMDDGQRRSSMDNVMQAKQKLQHMDDEQRRSSMNNSMQAKPKLQHMDEEQRRSSMSRLFKTSFKLAVESADEKEGKGDEEMDDSYGEQLQQLHLLQCL